MFRQVTSIVLTSFICIASVFIISCDGGGSSTGGSSDAESVSEDKDNLAITYAGSDSASSVTQNLILPATGDNGSIIRWQSDNTAIIAINGSVTRPSFNSGNASVTITATISKGSSWDTKTFTLTVIAAPVTDTDCVADDKANLVITYADGDSASGVTQSIITLPGTGSSGTTISWQSNKIAVIENNGTVKRPSYTSGNAAVVLTATISKGSASDTKTFNLTVLKAAQTEQEAVAEDAANLAIIYSDGDSASSVMHNITLPLSGASGTVISWVSDNAAIVVIADADPDTDIGSVTRPTFTGSDATVTLTATITKGSASATKTFTPTVSKQPNVNLASITVTKGKLQPVFNASVTDYLDAPVPFSDNTDPAYNDTQSAGVTAIVADANAVMTINGTVVPSGDEYEMNNLKVGKNNAVITISVPLDIITKTYTIEVYRAIPVFKTGQTSTDAGVSWPSPRFTDNGDGTVTDKMTKLMWIKNANAIKTLYPDFDIEFDFGGHNDGKVKWATALEFIGNINKGTYKCGATTTYTDWRMPNVREMRTLLLYSQDFSLITGTFTSAAILRDDWYFTSTTDPTNTDYAIITNFYQSSIYIGKKEATDSILLNYVWPVRSAP